ncbi:MAG: hypothetical protein M3042_12125 [Actinomycetota bacterium]|nr:hypothetical protein [Actinomycetota bacterium]
MTADHANHQHRTARDGSRTDSTPWSCAICAAPLAAAAVHAGAYLCPACLVGWLTRTRRAAPRTPIR